MGLSFHWNNELNISWNREAIVYLLASACGPQCCLVIFCDAAQQGTSCLLTLPPCLCSGISLLHPHPSAQYPPASSRVSLCRSVCMQVKMRLSPHHPHLPQASYSSLPIELPGCSGCGDSNLSLEVQFGYGFVFFLWYIKWPTSHTVTAVAAIQPTVSPAQLKLQHRLW